MPTYYVQLLSLFVVLMFLSYHSLKKKKNQICLFAQLWCHLPCSSILQFSYKLKDNGNFYQICIQQIFTGIFHSSVPIISAFHHKLSGLPLGMWQNSTSLPHQVVLVVKNPLANAGDETSSTPGLGRSPRGGHSNPFQYSCLENSMDRGAWKAIVHGVFKSQTRLK